MGKRNDDRKTRKLDLRKETLRNLRSIGDAELGQVAGGRWTGGELPPPPSGYAPSLSGC